MRTAQPTCTSDRLHKFELNPLVSYVKSVAGRAIPKLSLLEQARAHL